MASNPILAITSSPASLAAPQEASRARQSGTADEGAAAVGGQVKNQGTQVEQADLERAVSKLNDYVQNVQRALQFSVDEDSGRTIITVLDSETKEVIRQIPPEEVLNLARTLHKGKGVILGVWA